MLDGIDIGILVWLIVGVVSGVGEMMTGAMFLLPFAIAAIVAGVLVAVGVDMVWSMGVFAAISVVALIALRRFAIQQDQDAIQVRAGGGGRYTGASGVVTGNISAGESGRVRVETESWRAVAHDGEPIDEGSRVRVIEVRGNVLVVEAVADRAKMDPETN